MGRICPILNHPLKDGLLIDDDAVVKFIQKRNVDFLPNELVCRSCKREILKLYNKKLKKAIELHKSRLHENSISSYKTSSRSSTISDNSSTTINGSRPDEVTPNGRSSNTSTRREQNLNKTNSMVQNNKNANSSSKSLKIQTAEIISVSSTSITVSTSISNSHSVLQENQQNQKILQSKTPMTNDKDHVTVRKRTIKDFLTSKPKTSIEATKTLQIASTATLAPNNKQSKKSSHINYDTEQDDDDDVVRRLSQQPSTSKTVAITNNSTAATNSKKRPISAIVDSDDDDDERLSLNAYNGTRLPHIQPIPPKRKSPNPATTRSIGHDIMNDYIKDVTGG